MEVGCWLYLWNMGRGRGRNGILVMEEGLVGCWNLRVGFVMEECGRLWCRRFCLLRVGRWENGKGVKEGKRKRWVRS